jgi:hypothetical protein
LLGGSQEAGISFQVVNDVRVPATALVVRRELTQALQKRLVDDVKFGIED